MKSLTKKIFKKKDIVAHINLDIYKTNLFIFLNCRELKKHVESSNIPDFFESEELKEIYEIADDNPLAYCGWCEGSCYIILNDHGKSSWSKVISALTHEINHIAIHIMEHIGSDINHETSEPFCYLTEYILNQIFEIIETE